MHEMAVMKAVPVTGMAVQGCHTTTVPSSHMTSPSAHAGPGHRGSAVAAPATGHVSATHTTMTATTAAVTVCDGKRGQQ